MEPPSSCDWAEDTQTPPSAPGSQGFQNKDGLEVALIRTEFSALPQNPCVTGAKSHRLCLPQFPL